MPHVEKELFTLPEHPRSSPVFSVVRVVRSLVFCIMFCRSLFVLLSFFVAIVLYVILRYTDSDDPFGIFKFFATGSTFPHRKQRPSECTLNIIRYNVFYFVDI